MSDSSEQCTDAQPGTATPTTHDARAELTAEECARCRRKRRCSPAPRPTASTSSIAATGSRSAAPRPRSAPSAAWRWRSRSPRWRSRVHRLLHRRQVALAPAGHRADVPLLHAGARRHAGRMLVFLGVGLVLWAKWLMPEEETVQDRHDVPSTEEDKLLTEATLIVGLERHRPPAPPADPAHPGPRRRCDPGLIGSSIMRAARAQDAVRTIVTTSRSPETRKRVLELGIADRVVETNTGGRRRRPRHRLRSGRGLWRGRQGNCALPQGRRDRFRRGFGQGRHRARHVTASAEDHAVRTGSSGRATEHSGPDAGFAELFENRWCILARPRGPTRKQSRSSPLFGGCSAPMSSAWPPIITTWCSPSPEQYVTAMDVPVVVSSFSVLLLTTLMFFAVGILCLNTGVGLAVAACFDYGWSCCSRRASACNRPAVGWLDGGLRPDRHHICEDPPPRSPDRRSDPGGARRRAVGRERRRRIGLVRAARDGACGRAVGGHDRAAAAGPRSRGAGDGRGDPARGRRRRRRAGRPHDPSLADLARGSPRCAGSRGGSSSSRGIRAWHTRSGSRASTCRTRRSSGTSPGARRSSRCGG